MFEKNPSRKGIRKVDLNNWVDYNMIGKAQEFESRVKAENPEFDLLWEEIEYLKYNRYIFETNENGIQRFEGMLGITNPKVDLEQRRQEVYFLWNKKIIWTDRTLREWLNEIMGYNNYDIKLLYNDYIFEFVIYAPQKKGIDNQWLSNQLRKIIPANLFIRWKLVIEQKIYYGMTTQTGKKITLKPYTAEDFESKKNLHHGMGIYYKRIIRKMKAPEVFTTNYLEMIEEVTAEGERLKYE